MIEKKNERKNRKIVEPTLQHHEECSSEDAIAGIGTMAHVDHDHVIGIGVAACMGEIQRDEVEKWSSRKLTTRRRVHRRRRE
jgi:hypothetical protein